MNLLMCCTPINRDATYESELRFPILASLFYRRLNPQGRVFVATTMDAKIPDWTAEYFDVIRYDFRAAPFSIMRQKFYQTFVESELFTDDTILAGCDVLFTGRPMPKLPKHKMLMSYRYNPAMPYCGDLFIARHEHKAYASQFFGELFETMRWMPQKIWDGGGDQLAQVIAAGKLPEWAFDGGSHYAPLDKSILLVPGDDWLYTPNDFFPSQKAKFTGESLGDVAGPDALLRLMDAKISVHFKGQRKAQFFLLAYLAHKNGLIDSAAITEKLGEQFLFREVFNVEQIKKEAAGAL